VPIEVTMPKLSPTMETGVISQWLVKVGDVIKEGDTLADIETDKATMPMKSYDDGTIVHLDQPAGAEVALGQRVMVLAKKGEDPKQVVASLGLGKAPAETVKAAGSSEVSASTPGIAAATVSDHSPGHPTGNGEQASSNGNGATTERTKVSPLARKIATASHIDIRQIKGSGPGGRVVRRDVDAFVQQPVAPNEAAKPSAIPAPVRPVAAPLAAQRIPHTRMRKTIAQRMLQAKQTAPEIHLTIDIRADKLSAAREELNRRLTKEGIKLSLGDFVTKGVALALRKHPAVNASYETDAIVRHGEVNLGIAVALPEGLIVPVLHRADTLGLREIRQQSEALAAAARASSLSGEQLTGSTFTISNLGMFGIKQFDAILNMPEVGILAVGAAEKRPVVEGDRIVVGTVMSVTLTADHRAVDGATAAEFLQTLKILLEEPTAMLL
jgi:pyruvate dehydrogenase E2 component (dihydrolipoamide acetyltransferase)